MLRVRKIIQDLGKYLTGGSLGLNSQHLIPPPHTYYLAGPKH